MFSFLNIRLLAWIVIFCQICASTMNLYFFHAHTKYNNDYGTLPIVFKFLVSSTQQQLLEDLMNQQYFLQQNLLLQSNIQRKQIYHFSSADTT